MNDSWGMSVYAALTRPTFFAYVDWDKRDSVKAAMPNAARVVLRRLGCPISAREVVLDQLLGAMKAGDSGE